MVLEGICELNELIREHLDSGTPWSIFTENLIKFHVDIHRSVPKRLHREHPTSYLGEGHGVPWHEESRAHFRLTGY